MIVIKNIHTKAPFTPSAELTTVLDYCDTNNIEVPPVGYLRSLDNFIQNLKSEGIWAKKKLVYVLCGVEGFMDFKILNLKTPGANTLYEASLDASGGGSGTLAGHNWLKMGVMRTPINSVKISTGFSTNSQSKYNAGFSVGYSLTQNSTQTFVPIVGNHRASYEATPRLMGNQNYVCASYSRFDIVNVTSPNAGHYFKAVDQYDEEDATFTYNSNYESPSFNIEGSINAIIWLGGDGNGHADYMFPHELLLSIFLHGDSLSFEENMKLKGMMNDFYKNCAINIKYL